MLNAQNSLNIKMSKIFVTIKCVFGTSFLRFRQARHLSPTKDAGGRKVRT